MKKLFIPILGLTGLLMMSFTVKPAVNPEINFSELDLLSKIENDMLGLTTSTEFTEIRTTISFTTYSTSLETQEHTEVSEYKSFTAFTTGDYRLASNQENKLNALIEKYN